MKSPRTFSLRTGLALLVAGTAFATMPRYEVYTIGFDNSHDALPRGTAVRKKELPHMPFVRGIQFQYTYLGGPSGDVSCDGPYTEYISHDGSTCDGINQSGVNFCGYRLRSVHYWRKGESLEATTICEQGDRMIQEYSAQWEKQ